MSRRSASERYNRRRLEMLDGERKTLETNARGVFETVLATPVRYCVGMSMLEFHIILRQLATWPDTLCERVFYPEPDELNWRRRSSRPVVTMDSGRSMANFDLIVFSINFVTDYRPMLEMMSMSGLKLPSSQRRSPWPLIACCGLPSTANPLPLAPFVDFFIIGETEPSLGPVLDTIKSLGSQGAPKRILLERISSLPGLYVPAVHGVEKQSITIMRQWAMSEALRGQSVFVTQECEGSGMIIVETARGCPFNCRYCLDGYIHLPYRERKPEEVMASIESLPKGIPLALAAQSPSVHTGLPEILDCCRKARLKTSVGSLRTDSPDEMADGTDLQGNLLVLFPEVGSDSLRRVIGKKLTNEELIQQMDRARRKCRLSRIRLHFKLGMPFETDEDRIDIVKLVRSLRRKTRIPITVQLANFVPRPWTAFQWMPMVRPQHLRRHAGELIEELESISRVEIRIDDARESQIEALLARGDHRAGLALANSVSGLSWTASFEKAGVSMDWVFEQLEPGSPFPWDFLNMGFGHTRLARELTSAMSADLARHREEITPPEPEDDGPEDGGDDTD